MVIKIQKSYPSVKGTLDYNFRKVSSGKASVIGTCGMQKIEDAREIFGIYERRNIRTKNLSLQISINPNPEEEREQLTDEEAFDLAKELMARMGYGNQPFLVFKHQDIERTHYHIVSVRVNEKGRKINDSNEKRKLQKAMQKLADRYRFTIGNEAEKKKEKKKPERKDTEQKPSDIRQRCLEKFYSILEYDTKTFGQFSAVAESKGLKLTDISEDRDGQPCITLQYQDLENNDIREPISEIELGIELSRLMNEHVKKCRESKRDTLKRRKEIAVQIEKALKTAKDIDQLRNNLKKENLSIHFSRTADGEIFGATIIDHKTKTAFKASDISRSLSAKMFRELEKESDRTSETRTAEKTTKTKSSAEKQHKSQTGEKEKPETQHNETHRIQNEYHGEQAADNADIVSIAADELMRSGSSEVRDKVSEELEKDGKRKPRKPRYI